ncbi:MAG: NAD+ synthase [Solirubrobacterales bacterium]
MPDSAPLRTALCQVNTTVGDIDGNAALILQRAREAREAGAAAIAFPELTLTGYPPEDLLLKEHFLAATERSMAELAGELESIDAVCLIGFAERDGENVFNSLAVVRDGVVTRAYRKMLLPNYGVFDERRYFAAGEDPAVIEVQGVRIGLTICEDVWERHSGPLSGAERGGASLILNVSASPYHAGKGEQRREMLAGRARDHGLHVALCSLVGGQDELVFDGQSMVLDPRGELLARAAQFEEEILLFDLESGAIAPALGRHAEVYAALRLGVRDYVRKNGFERVMLGLSGGIDSALTACVAVDALGAERVSGVVMPSPHSSKETQRDAHEIARRLGVDALDLPIDSVMRAYSEVLARSLAGTKPDVTEENIQARIRGNLVMALSNKFGWLPLTTGNKSEYSVGYTTLYGDMAGGFAVLKDVPKTLVFELARWRNEQACEPPIPEDVIDRPPSAELRPDQSDQDSLPPYEVLDPILEAYVERDHGREELIERGFDAATVDRVIALVDRAEYKRRQAPPGIKITPRAFGRDRRLPITNRFGG